MKWIGVIALAVIGVLSLIVAIEWLTVPIHSLPAVIGGKHIRGHYKRRGEALLVFSIVMLGLSTYLFVRIRRSESSSGEARSVASTTSGTPAGETLGTTAPVVDSAPVETQTPVETAE